jgi:hypothetical protein
MKEKTEIKNTRKVGRGVHKKVMNMIKKKNMINNAKE